MQTAQEYLAKVVPWPQEGDPSAYINIHWMLDKLNHYGKPIWTGRATRSVQEAVNTVKWALSLPETKDIYVCMSSQKDAQQKIAKKSGRPYLFPIRGQANAVAFKSLFMDLDAKGKDKGSYDTLAEALSAFSTFIAAVGLPKPNVIVKTGGGFHVYWTFERAISIQEWQPLSNALAAAAVAHGLKFDTACTVDSARLLRVPATFNHKLANRRPVVLAGGRTAGDYLLARLEAALEPYKGVTPQVTPAAPKPQWDLSAFPPLPPIDDGDKLSAGISEDKVDINDIAAVCPFINEAVTTGGKEFGNPLWNLTTLIATMTEGGRDDAHAMAGAHASYNRQDTDDLYDRKERERKAKGLGWPACRTISNNGYPGCTGCVHLAANRSALYAAATVAAAASATAGAAPQGAQGSNGSPVGALPPGYSQRGDKVVCQILVAEDGTHDHEPICRYPFFSGYLEEYPIYALHFSTTFETGRTTQIAAPVEALSDKSAMCRCLGKQGVALQEGETKRVKEFLMSWIKTLQETKKVVTAVPYGWSMDSKSNIEGFVYGGNLWMPTGQRQASTPDKVLATRYTPRGTNKNPWVAAAKLITDQKRPALDAIVASAFAAPLIKFCYEPGVLMSTYSTKSGIGKTSALKVAQAVWGDPIRAMQGLDDTQNFVFNKIGAIRNLPMYWDELKTEEDTKRFTNLVFKLTNQKEKDRLTQNSTMKESGTWNTMLVSASNDSLMQFVVHQAKQTTAGINRIFEYEVPAATGNTGQIDQADASRILGRLNDNYGHIGLEYASYLGSNHTAVAKEVEEFYKSTGHLLNTSQEERYWRVMVACLLKGAEYANKLNFTNIDLPILQEFLFDVVGNMRLERSGSTVDLTKAINVSDVMGQFLISQQSRHTLYTDKIHRKVGKAAAGDISIKRHIDKLEGVNVHYALEDKVLRISKTFMQEWLRKNNHPVSAIMKAAIERYSAKIEHARLGAGTDYASGGKLYLIEIDYAKNPDLDPEV